MTPAPSRPRFSAKRIPFRFDWAAMEKPRLSIAKLHDQVSHIFASAQESGGSHGACCRNLQRIQNEAAVAGATAKFRKAFTAFLNKILVVFKREPVVERIVSFLLKFVRLPAPPGAFAAAEARGFVEYLVSYLVDCLDSVDKAVRFRSCQLLGGLVADVAKLTACDEYVCLPASGIFGRVLLRLFLYLAS